MLPETNKPRLNSVIANKQLIQKKCEIDGKLVSPIDLTLDATKTIQLEPLHWFNFDEVPVRMKLTNSGDTLVVSAKWGTERPYLKGGPLDGNYVFSQIHFHWGSSEHEGSEHTVRGVCYPLEMHVVFYKTVYLTQAAALKQNDGVIILAYLFKLQSRTAPGLHWLVSQLDNVVEPHSSAQVPPMPLASVLVPFSTDYVSYWGSLSSQHCSHPVMWLVSRSALSVTSDDLSRFRCLLNSKKETMTKNFRATSPAAGRTIFHINPTYHTTTNLLLPGAKDPPCRAVTVNCALTPPAHTTTARTLFEKGDSKELELKGLLRNRKPPTRSNSQKCYQKGSMRNSTGEANYKVTLKVTKPESGTVNKNSTELKETKTHPSREKQLKSRLPVPTLKRRLTPGLESQYASYFRPVTAPSNWLETKPHTPLVRPCTQS